MDRRPRTLLRHPLFVACALLLAAVGCALFYDPIGWAWTASVLAVIVLGVGWPWLVVRLAGVEVRVGETGVDLGSPVEVELTRLGPSWLASQPVQLSLAGQTLSLTSRRSVVQVVPERRGRFPQGRVSVTCDAPFGLFRSMREAGVRSTTTVLPTGPAVTVPVSRLQTSDHARIRTTAPSGGETLGLREYRRGDPPRQIHWAATARLDKLIARERLDTSRPVVTLWFDTTSFAGAPIGSESSYERAIALTAGMIRSWTDGASRVELVMPGRSFQINWLPDLRAALEALAMLPADARLIERVALRGSTPDVLVTAADESQGRAGRVFRFEIGTMDASELAAMVRVGGGRVVARA
jgi:uncharacterized protein (DUF58 family)